MRGRRGGSGRGGNGNRRGGNRDGGYRRNNRRGGGGGNRRNHRGGGRGGYRNGRGRGGKYRSGAQSGNMRERIAVESGHLVLIDQFMLANPQFQAQLVDLIDKEPAEKDDLVRKYGGTVVELEPGNYRILRDPYSFKIVIHSAEHEQMDLDEVAANATDVCGDVLVDTRCLAMVDRELLDDTDLLEKYQQLWFSDQDKACRDLLRDNGGAVRYGFERSGDELQVFAIPNEDTICMMPQKAAEAVESAEADVEEDTEGEAEAEEAAA